MEINIEYGAKTKLTEQEIEQVISTSQKYATVSTSQWGVRAGATDILPILEFSFGFSIIQAMAKPIVEGYFKGLFDENYFKNMGEQHKLLIQNMIKYPIDIYNTFVKQKLNESDAIPIVEIIENYHFYVVLNSSKMSENLIKTIFEAMYKAVELIPSLEIEDDVKVIQLYPNFDKQEWDYLFIPTPDAFGKYINRYYCFSENVIHNVDSASDFIDKFQITDIDQYKLIINPH